MTLVSRPPEYSRQTRWTSSGSARYEAVRVFGLSAMGRGAYDAGRERRQAVAQVGAARSAPTPAMQLPGRRLAAASAATAAAGVQLLLQRRRRRELRGVAGLNLDRLASRGVAALASLAVRHAELPEPRDGNFAATGELGRDRVENGVDRLAGVAASQVCVLGDLLGQFLLGHALISRGWMG